MHRLLALLLILFPASAGAQGPESYKTILFVCEHGAAKSVVAAAHFNKLASERGLHVRAISRGTSPDAKVPDPIREGLRGEGLPLDAGFKPTLVRAPDVDGAARVIVFDVALPEGAQSTRLTRWDGLPAFSDGYASASGAIAAKVSMLVAEMAGSRR